MWVGVRNRESECESVCKGLIARERSVCTCAFNRERESVCVCLCVCVCERE